MPLLELDAVSKKYKKGYLLEGLSFQIEEGELFGIAGGRGSGKSLIANILAGHVKPSSGSVFFRGDDMRRRPDRQKMDWGIALQGMGLYPKMSAGRLVELSMKLHGEREWSWVEDVLQYFELDYDLKVQQMTLGERQRLVLCCAFAHQPAFYLLDEPAQNLDVFFRKKLFSLLQERVEEGAGALLLSDQWAHIEQYCHGSALLTNGELVGLEDLRDKKFLSKRVMLRNIMVLEKDLIHPKVQGIQFEHGDVSFVYHGDFAEISKFVQRFGAGDVLVQDVSLEDKWACLEGEPQ